MSISCSGELKVKPRRPPSRGVDESRLVFELFNPSQRFDPEGCGGSRNGELSHALDLWDPTVESRDQFVQFANRPRTSGLRDSRSASHRHHDCSREYTSQLCYFAHACRGGTATCRVVQPLESKVLRDSRRTRRCGELNALNSA